LAPASAGDAAGVGRGDGKGAIASGVDGGERGAAGGGAAPGSGVMMLTGGVEAALGKSALVGLPVVPKGDNAATGIGAGGGTSGQVLVLHDMLGLGSGRKPRFVRNFMAEGGSIAAAIGRYVAALRSLRQCLET